MLLFSIIAAFSFFTGQQLTAQSAGFNSSYSVFSINSGSDAYYCMFSSTSCGVNPGLDGANLGTFTLSANTLVLKGAEHNVWKCGGADISATTLNYRIYKTGDTPPSFIGTSIGYLSGFNNGCGGQDQQWKDLTKNINVLSGLTPGNYTIEIFSDATTTVGTQYLSNSSNNYKATFSVACPSATTLYVDQSISSSGNGTSWASALKTLDEALFIAHNCPGVTTINVAAGTYIPTKKPYENGVEMTTTDDRDVTFHLPDGIAIYGGFPNGGGSQDVVANPTILSGDIGTVIDNSDNTYHVVLASASSIDGIGVTIDGFSITGGNANESGTITVNGNDIEVGNGGGIATYYGTNTLTNNIFLGNLAFSGGGMYSIEGMNSLTDNTFSGNSAYSEGGGMYIIQGMNSFTNNTFSGNLADFFGGGIYIIEGTNSLTNNTFSGNSAIYDGGGIYTFEGTNTLSNNTLSGNLAEIGGGLYIYDGMNSLTNNTFSENSASFDGGGIYTFLGTHTFANNTFSGNSANFGGGMYIIESMNSLINNTFSGNSASFDGGGIYTFDGTNTLSNNIFWGNKIGTDPNVLGADYYADGTNDNTFVNNLLQFASSNYTTDANPPYGIGVAATGNIFATNPIFVNAADIDGADNIHRTADDGLRLQLGSPAINAGDNSVVTELTDITGAARIQNTTVDLGAYEGGVCHDLTAAAPVALVSSESTCTGCALSGGVIAAPATACPTGSTLQYSTDNGTNWSTTLPTYNQTTSVTVLTRCVCDIDSNTVSPTSSVTTEPGECASPTAPVITGTTTFCAGGSTTLSIDEQPGATYCWQNTNNALWQTVGSAGFSAGSAFYQRIAFLGSTPYVAYRDAGNGGKTTVMRYNGSAWETVGSAGFSAGGADDLSIAFYDSTPYVAYRDAANSSKATVMRYNGTAWENVGNAGFSAGQANFQSLAFNGSTPYVAYQDGTNGNKTTVMRYNGSTWETVGNAGFLTGGADFQSLAFNGSTPYVAYRDGANKTTVIRYNGTTWETVGNAGFSAGVASGQSLAFYGGTPYVAYAGLGTTVMRFNGSAWENVGNPNFSAGFANYQSLAFNGSTPYVAYRDWGNGDRTTVMRYNGTTWENVGSAGFSAGQTSYISLAFNGSTPYVAYRDGGNSSKTTAMKFEAPCIGSSSSLEVSAPGTYTVVVTAANGCTAEATPVVVTEETCCPDLTAAAPPAIVSSESTCTGCALSGGVIAPPATACPTGSTLEYSTNNGNSWSTTLPTYNQTTAVTVLTRCVCDIDSNISSPTGSVTTVPGVCTSPTAPVITGTTTFCAGGSTTLSIDEQPGATYCWQNTNNALWQTVGSAGFSAGGTGYQSLAFHGSTPYVAYQDVANGNRTTVMRYNGSAWENVGNAGFSAGTAQYQSLAFNGSIPYVAYSDGANSFETTVMRYNGSTWETVGIAGFSAGTAQYQSLAFNGSTPNVAYQDDGNGGRTTVMKFNGTAWENIGNAGFSAGAAASQSLAFTGSTPYVAYQDGTNGNKTTVMRYNGSAWETIGIAGFSAGGADYPRLAFNGSTPYVAFRNNANGGRTTVMRYNGSTWEYVGIAGFSAGSANHQSLAFNDSTPYVAYQDVANGNRTTVMRYNGSNWENVGSAGFSTGQAIYQSLVFNGSTPYVAYRDGGNGFKTTVMKFEAPCIGSSSSLEVSAPGTYTVVVTAANGCTAEATPVVVTEETCCPDLTAAAPPAIVSSESTCTGCALSGGVIAPPATTCPTGSTLEYSTDAGNSWSTTLPTYNQTTAVTVLTRCNCDADTNISSPTSSVTTVPGICTPVTAGISGTTTGCTSVTLTASGGSTYLWSGGSDPTSATNTFTTSGTYTVTVTGANGCEAMASVVVTIIPSTLYVDQSISSSGNGTSWATAFKTLDEALFIAHNCPGVTTINVAAGTYKPTKKPYLSGVEIFTADARDVTFHLANGVAMYGGFPNGGGTRDIAANPTILSGDIGTVSVTTDNAYHVVLSVSDAATTILDGFTVSGGIANGGSSITVEGVVGIARNSGGGILNTNSSPTISNCSIIDNLGNSGGGIAIVGSSSPTISNCTFTLNWSSNGGGIRSSSTTPPTITNSAFVKNEGSNGAGIYTGTANISNCTFFGNNAGTSGDDMVATAATIVNNCIFWGHIGPPISSGISGSPTINNSIVQGGYAGCTNCPNTNGNANPLFVNATDPDGADNIHRTADDGIRLLVGSPAIDAGDNSFIPSGITTDITGAARIQNTTVDLGAYEGGVCSTLTAAAPVAIVSSQSTCTGCALSGGVIAPPATACPTGSTLEYSTDNGNSWSTTLPTYNQTTAVTVLTRCNCNADTNTSSPTSSVTTVPGVCTPVSAGITNNTGTTQLSCNTTSISVTATGGSSYAWSGGATPTTAANSFIAPNTYTVTVTGSNGCTNSTSVTITIIPDTTPPTLATPGDQNLNVIAGTCAANYTIADPISDNCPNATWGYSTTGATTLTSSGNTIADGTNSGVLSFNKGLTTVTLTGNDGTNNATTVSFTVTVVDNEPPVITCAGTVTINNTPGLCTGTTTLTAPTVSDNCIIYNNALGFDGSNDEVVINHSASLQPTSTQTLEAWVYANDLNDRVIIHKWVPNQYTLEINENKLTYVLETSSGDNFVRSISNFPIGQWVHCAGTYDGTVLKVYENGILTGTVNHTGNISSGSGVLKIGSRTDNSSGRFSGKIDEVRIWNIVRTQSQLASDMSKELNAQTGLMAVYHFNQGIANDNNPGITTALNASGIGNNGTLNNFALSGTTSNWVNGVFGRVTNNAPTTYPVGTTTVIWTATDAVGNSATCSQTVTVVDNQSPSVTCPAATTTINTNTGASCQITIPNYVTMLNPTDNCTASGSIVEAQSIPAGAYGVSGDGSTVVVNYTATDGATVPNTTTCTVTITVNDDDAPTFTCPTPVLILNTTGNNGCEVTIPNLVAMVSDAADNCGLAAVPVTQSIAAGAYSGVSDGNTIPVTVTVTDAATPANTTSCTVTFTVNDDDPPVVTCPSATTVINTNAGASCEITIPNYVALLTPTDNCTASGSIVEAQTIPAGAYTTGVYHGATITVQYTATDSAIPANTTTCTVVITVNDDDAPTLANPGNQILNTILNTCAANYIILDPITDNCVATWSYTLNGATIGSASGIADGSNSNVISFNKGITTVALNGVDAGSNTAMTVWFTVTVLDNQAPTLTCPSNQSFNNITNTCAATYSLIDPIYDNCPGATWGFALSGATVSTSTGIADGANINNVSFNKGVTTVTFSGVDAASNLATTCSFTVSVTDNQPPTFTCPTPPLVLNTTGNNNCEVLIPNLVAMVIASDNCALATIPVVQSIPAGAYTGVSHGSTIPVSLTVTDASSNTAGCTVTFTVNDDDAPVLTCPNNIVQGNTLNTCQAAVSFTLPTPTDNCTGATLQSSHNSGSSFNVGTTTVTLTATDGVNNSTSCSFTVTVNDTQPPVAVCPSNITQPASAGQCSAAITYSIPPASDNCTGNPLEFATIPSGSNFNVGTTTVQVIATDAANNTGTCTFTVTITDNQPPVAQCPTNITQTLGTGICSTAVTYSIPTAFDNCGATSVAVPASGSTFNLGTSTVTVTATDAANHTSSCSFTVTLNGTQPPVAYCSPNRMQLTDAGQCYATVYFAVPNPGDDCGATSVATPASGTAFNIGTTTVVITATDEAGNTGTCSFTVTVYNPVTPLISGTPNGCGIVTLMASGGSSYLWSGGNTPNQAQNSFNTSGTYSVTVTNSSGCTNTASVVVTITPVTNNTTSVTACNSYTWAVNGQTYTSPGSYNYMTGCHTETLNLTINSGSNASNTTYMYACVSYTWPVNGQTYTTSGIYTHSEGCQTEILNLTINEGNTTVGSISGTSSSICEGETISTTAYGGTDYQWSGPNGFSASGSVLTRPNATMDMSGLYTVTISAGNGCGETIITTLIMVNPNPVASITGVNNICIGNTLSLTATGGLTYLWSGPGGYSNTASTITRTNASVLMSGTYFVTVTNVNGCIGTASMAVTVNAAPVVNISGATAVCTGSTINLTATGGGTYQWSGPGGFTATGANMTRTATAGTGGTYSVTVTDANGCTAIKAVTVTVATSSVSASITGTLTYCAGATITLTASGGATYQWSGPNSFSSMGNVLSIPNATPAMSGVYKVTVTNAGGCTASNSRTITVHPLPNAVITGNTNICAGSTLILSASGGTSYAWSGPSFSATTASISRANATVAMSGTYTVTVTGTGGCKSTASVVVTVNAKPVVTITGLTSVCSGTTITFTATGGDSYAWSGPGGFTATGETMERPGATTAMNGQYKVTVTNAAGCTSSASRSVTVIASPNAVITGVSTVCLGANFSQTASGGTSYAWSYPDGPTASGATITRVGATLPMDGTYNVTVTGSNGCKSTASKVIAVNNCTSKTSDDATETVLSAYPNPSDGLTTIAFTATATEEVSLSVFNVEGKEVAVLFNGTTEAHTLYEFEIDMSLLTPGTYYAVLHPANGQKQQIRLMVVR